MRIVYSERAADDMEAVVAYLHERNPQAARNIKEAILKTLSNLSLFPHSGRQQTIKAIRKMGIHRYPYAIYYSVDVDAEELAIVTIQHYARSNEFQDS